MVYVDARGNKTERMKNHDQKKHGSHFIKYRKTLRFSGEKKKNKTRRKFYPRPLQLRLHGIKLFLKTIQRNKILCQKIKTFTKEDKC